MAILDKFFLDYEGLSLYDELIKEYIKNNSSETAAEINEEISALTDRVEANEEAITILNGSSDVEGSVDQKVSKAVADLVNEAPETLDTLKEIADWISENGEAPALIERVSENEQKIEELKVYVDEQDKAYYDAIDSIEGLKIAALFPVKQGEDESAAVAILMLEEGKGLQLTADQVIEDNITINKACYIDANGSTFNGTVTVPADVEVIIENAVFAKPVVVA